MQLREIQLTHFKGYKSAHIAFEKPLIFVTGHNGVGKTNLLDAIYYLCIGRSYFQMSDQWNYHQKESYFVLQGLFESINDSYTKVRIAVSQEAGKQIWIHGKKLPRMSDWVGQIPVVMTTPGDQQKLMGASEERRRWMDAVLCQSDPHYLHHLQQYVRLLQQRNAWLRQEVPLAQKLSLAEQFIHQMETHANYVVVVRSQWIDQIKPVIVEYYRQLSDQQDEIEVFYQTDWMETHWIQGMMAQLTSDVQEQRTLKGIHRDDVLFNLKSLPLKTSGSQGQQKSVVLALTLSEIYYFQHMKGRNAILLMDDIFDKLDPGRCRRWISLLRSVGVSQCFFTDTDPNRLRNLIDDSWISDIQWVEIPVQNYKI